jgi:hypothetical protein
MLSRRFFLADSGSTASILKGRNGNKGIETWYSSAREVQSARHQSFDLLNVCYAMLTGQLARQSDLWYSVV